MLCIICDFYQGAAATEQGLSPSLMSMHLAPFVQLMQLISTSPTSRPTTVTRSTATGDTTWHHPHSTACSQACAPGRQHPAQVTMARRGEQRSAADSPPAPLHHSAAGSTQQNKPGSATEALPTQANIVVRSKNRPPLAYNSCDGTQLIWPIQIHHWCHGK